MADSVPFVSTHTLVVPSDPADRPLRVRRAMRVLLLDEADRLLLFRDSDLGIDPVPHWWITPGGGVDPGETDEEAVVREVHEETGLMLEPGDVTVPIAVREVIHGYSDVVVRQDEAFWLIRCRSFGVDTSRHTREERLTMTAHRWFRRDELSGWAEPIWPHDLARLWDAAVGGTEPLPIDLGRVEESTVPA